MNATSRPLKSRIAMLLGMLTAILLTSCSTPNAWHGLTKSRKPAGSINFKYEEYGHGTTAYVVARIAGWEPMEALRLSHFSQAPDKLAFRYSAPAVAVWGSVPGLWGYRHRIVAVLHSLHGGNADAVVRRRNSLHDLVAAAAKKQPNGDWQTGFLIHAFGDSYAHVKPGPGGREVAYGQGVGHGFDSSVKPDHISAHLETYKSYVNSLYSALAKNGADSAELKRFIDTVQEAMLAHESVREKAVEDAIRHFRPFSEIPGELKTMSLTEADFATWDKEIEGVDAFLKQVEKNL